MPKAKYVITRTDRPSPISGGPDSAAVYTDADLKRRLAEAERLGVPVDVKRVRGEA